MRDDGAFTAGAWLMTSVAFAGRVNDPYLAILLFSLAGFAHQTLSVTVITMASDLFRAERGGDRGRHGRDAGQRRGCSSSR